MDITILFLILGGALVGLFAYKLLKKTLSILFSAGFLVGILLAIFGFFILQDAIEFKDNFATSDNIFVLADGEEFLTAVALDLSEEGLETYKDLTGIAESVENEAVPEGYYKLFIITREAIEEAGVESIDFGFGEMDAEEALSILYSDSPLEDTAEALAKTEGIKKELIMAQLKEMVGNPDDVRSHLFTALMVNIFGRNPLNLIEGVKKENIIIYPETLMFSTIKLIPFSVFEQAEEVAGKNESDGQGQVLEE